MSTRSKTLMTLNSPKISMIPKTLEKLSELRTARYNRRKSSMGLLRSISKMPRRSRNSMSSIGSMRSMMKRPNG